VYPLSLIVLHFNLLLQNCPKEVIPQEEGLFGEKMDIKYLKKFSSQESVIEMLPK